MMRHAREKKGKSKRRGKSTRPPFLTFSAGGAAGGVAPLDGVHLPLLEGPGPELEEQAPNLVTSARRALCMRTKLAAPAAGASTSPSLSGGYSAGRTGVPIIGDIHDARRAACTRRRGSSAGSCPHHGRARGGGGHGAARRGAGRAVRAARARACARRRAKPLRENIARVKVREDNWREDRVSSASKPPRRVDGSQILDRKGCPQRVPRVADWVPKSSVKIDRR